MNNTFFYQNKQIVTRTTSHTNTPVGPLGVVHTHTTPPTQSPSPPSTSPHISPQPNTHSPPSIEPPTQPHSPFPSLPSNASSTIDPNSSHSTSPIATPPHNTHHMITRSKTGPLKPPLYPNLNLTTTESTCVPQALASPYWAKAMQDEFDALQENNIWSLAPLPSG